MHRTLESISARLRGGDPVAVVAFGDNPAAGSTGEQGGDEPIIYHAQWHARLQAAHPALNLSIINRARHGDTIDQAHERVQTDVIDARPDVVIVSFGLNDCRQGPRRIDHFERQLSGLVWRIRRHAQAAVILMTGNMLNYRYPAAASPAAMEAAAVQNAGWTTHYMNRVREVAAERDVPLADGYARWEAARRRGIDTDELLANGVDEPTRAGHALLADALHDVLH